MLGFFCLNDVIYFFITWFPSYLVDARGFDLLQLGIFFASTLAGVLGATTTGALVAATGGSGTIALPTADA